jgi:hypothetical protein
MDDAVLLRLVADGIDRRLQSGFLAGALLSSRSRPDAPIFRILMSGYPDKGALL